MADMPKVSKCDTTDCVYNVDRNCRALAISVSSGQNPECETYGEGKTKSGEAKAIAGVGACKAEACEYNKNLMCHAKLIKVGHKGEAEAACLTFEARQFAHV